MDAHRIEIFHVADRDTGIFGIPHHFILDLFPSLHASLDQHLTDRAGLKAATNDLLVLVVVAGDTAAGPSQGISGSNDEGKGHLATERLSLLPVEYSSTGWDWLANLQEQALEKLAVLRLSNRL